MSRGPSHTGQAPPQRPAGQQASSSPEPSTRQKRPSPPMTQCRARRAHHQKKRVRGAKTAWRDRLRAQIVLAAAAGTPMPDRCWAGPPSIRSAVAGRSLPRAGRAAGRARPGRRGGQRGGPGRGGRAGRGAARRGALGGGPAGTGRELAAEGWPPQSANGAADGEHRSGLAVQSWTPATGPRPGQGRRGPTGVPGRALGAVTGRADASADNAAARTHAARRAGRRALRAEYRRRA